MAVEPAALEASLAAVAEVERERSELSRHWQLRRERAGIEVDRAAHTVDSQPADQRREVVNVGSARDIDSVAAMRGAYRACDG